MSENQSYDALPAPPGEELELTNPSSPATEAATGPESRELVARFICPQCGGRYLDQWIIGLRVSCEVVGVTPEGHLLYDCSTEEADGNGEIRYSCRECDFDIPYDEDEEYEDGDEDYFVAKWIFQNCDECVREGLKGGSEDDHAGTTLKFTCPQCGGHRLQVIRLHTCEVTPVEGATAEGELSFGTMLYFGGEHSFQCLDCDFKLAPDVDDPNKVGQALASWIADNCSQA
ncbi:MAG: hypothetical protein V1792_09645 [Pseudomonadota bacterium]